jgi:hypothetical protein
LIVTVAQVVNVTFPVAETDADDPTPVAVTLVGTISFKPAIVMPYSSYPNTTMLPVILLLSG